MCSERCGQSEVRVVAARPATSRRPAVLVSSARVVVPATGLVQVCAVWQQCSVKRKEEKVGRVCTKRQRKRAGAVSVRQ